MSEIEPGPYADVMPDMTESEYDALKRSIKTTGFDETQPIVVDGDGNIVDGHHRFRACEEVGVDPEIVVDESATPEDAYRRNLARRNLDGGTKHDVVKRYLEEYYEDDRTQEKIAAELGVAQSTVSKAWKEIKPDDFTREEKRQQAEAYLREHPEASNRKVAREIEADVSHPTVGNWRDEWAESHGDDAPADEEPDDDAGSEGDVSGPDSTVAGDGTSVSGPSEGVSGPTGEADDSDRASTDGGAATSSLSEKGEFEVDAVDHTAEVSDGGGEAQPSNDPVATGDSKSDRVRELEARVNELEDVLSDMVDAFENHDAEKLEWLVNGRASEVLDA